MLLMDYAGSTNEYSSSRVGLTEKYLVRNDLQKALYRLASKYDGCMHGTITVPMI